MYKKKTQITPLLLITLYAITIFVYADFGISRLIGFAALAGFGIIFAFKDKNIFIVQPVKIAAFIIVVAITAMFLLPYARIDATTIAIVLSIDLSLLYVIIANPDESDVKTVLRILMVYSIIISLYAVLVTSFPQIFNVFIKRIVTSETQRRIETGFQLGYGIFIGGEVIFVDYVAALGLFITTNYLMIKGKKCDKKFAVIIGALICFAGILVQNRKSELLTALIVVAILFLGSIHASNIKQKLKRWGMFLILMVILVLALLLLINNGYLTRYAAFLNNIIGNSTGATSADISTGRFKLWARAWPLFLEHPIFGIGFGNFKLHISDSYNVFFDSQMSNVHNCYLQILCETGIIGFLLIAVPLLYILYRSYKVAKRVRIEHPENIIARLSATTSLSFQLFFMIVAFIDPVWYKLFTWAFYAVAVILIFYSEHILNRKMRIVFKTNDQVLDTKGNTR